MNKIFAKVAGVALGLSLAIGVGVGVGSKAAINRADAADTLVYTLDGTITGGTNGYAEASSITQDTITWEVTGNTTMNPWRLGGKGLSNVNRDIKSTAAVSSEDISKVEVVVGGTGSSLAVNSVSLKVGTAAGGEQTDSETKTSDLTNTTLTFTKPSGHNWSSKYFTVVFNVTRTSTSGNGYVQCSAVKFYKASSATLESISLVKDDSTVKTDYVDGDTVLLTGISCLGTFSDSTQSDVSGSCTITADKAKVALGDTSITYSATYNEGGITIPNLVLSISVSTLTIEKVETNGNFRIDYVQKQKFSYGTGKLKVTYNNGSSTTINPTDAGVKTYIGTTEISGTHYMTLDDDGKVLKLTYSGFEVEIGTISVTPYVEPEAGYWSPITDISDLEDGLEVIIVASGHEFAMGTYSSGNNVTAIDISKDGESKISSSIPGVRVYTLVESDAAEGTFALYDGTQYLAATGGISANKLQSESSISANSSFAISINAGVMSIIGQGSTESSARMTMRYNSTDIIFSCYGSTSSIGSLACLYKFTAEAKSEDQIAVETFVKTYLHLDENAEDYIDPNDNTSGTECKGSSGYYAVAKLHYADLTADQKEIFATSADVLIAQGRARLTAWAEANGEEFDENNDLVEKANNAFSFTESNNSMTLITIIAATSLMSFAALIVLKKKKLHK